MEIQNSTLLLNQSLSFTGVNASYLLLIINITYCEADLVLQGRNGSILTERNLRP